MKKLSILAIILIATCAVALAQPRAIGGRLGHSWGASYQHSFGEKNMLQADLDLLGYWWGIQGTVTYDWLFPIHTWELCSMNWYAGVGAGAGYRYGWRGWSRWDQHHWGWNGYGFAGVAGMIGVECNFKFGLQLSVDWRPLIGPTFNKYGVGYFWEGLYAGAVGFGVRYKFK